MTADRWDRLERLLDAASEIPEDERAAFVERETAGDPELRAELTSLLEASSQAADYLGRLRLEVLGTDVEGLLRHTATAADAPDPWIGRTVSHYEILGRLGGGGMGVVYRARDGRLGRAVALKFIAPEIRRDSKVRERFMHEARAASALDHPNICTIHEIAETDDGRLFIVMALYDGETLRARIARGPMSEDEALDLGEQVARALAAAHGRGIVHRDVKPENVFVTREGVVKLLDFGLARTDDSRMSGPGAAEGTVAYMSPERARGLRADERSDVWAFGVILFEMLAGVRPFAAADPAQAIERILTQEPDLRAARPDVAPGIADIVHRSLTKEPGGRFANGGKLLDALRRSRVARAASRWPVARRRALPIGAAIVALIAVVVIMTSRMGGSSGAPGAGAVTGSVSHVLWVDDSPEGNAGVAQALRDRGVEVTIALNTADAIGQYDPAVHQLVISDMGRYEGVNDAYVGRAGFDLLERLRARHAGAQVVFCTSERAVTRFRAEALSAGALEIVTDCREVLQLIGLSLD